MNDLTNRHFQSWAAEVSARSDSLHDFLRFFDDADNPEQSWMSGFWDFAYHILKPKGISLLGAPFEKTALEIGYGGGRLLHAACHYFRRVIGVDVHGFQELVRSLLEVRGVSNFQLHQTDGLSIPLGDSSIDFVYSFIVLQHLPTVEALRRNLVEVYRVMHPSAVAILYFGYLPSGFWHRKAFSDLTTRPTPNIREVTLRLTMPYARSLLNDTGFHILEIKRSPKKPWRSEYGGQFYAMLSR